MGLTDANAGAMLPQGIHTEIQHPAHCATCQGKGGDCPTCGGTGMHTQHALAHHVDQGQAY